MKPIKKNHNRYVHGMRRTRFYRIWIGIKTRCNNKNHVWFKHYGGKGIKVCKRWEKFESFRDNMYASYIEHVKNFGEKNTSIDRANNNKEYSTKNCRWATKEEQSNNASNNRIIEFKGKKQSIKKWAEELGIRYGTLYNRIFVFELELSDAMSQREDWRNRPRKKYLKTIK